MSPTVCPVCGAPVLGGSTMCSECGSDDSTGWASSPDTASSRRSLDRSRLQRLVTLLVIVVLLRVVTVNQSWWIAAVLVVVGIALYLLWHFLDGNGLFVAPFSDVQTADESFGRLVTLCHGDREMAERLIAHEAARTAGSTRVEQIDAAIAQLLRDRH